jgi:glycosyltransferase involved in cell wall biosynthesis
MNILYLTNSPIIGGAELSLLEHIKAIDTSKFHVTLVCSELLAPQAQAIAGVEVISMDFYLLNKANLSTLAKYWKMASRVSKIVREKHIDILHTNSVKAHYIGVAVKILTGVKLIWWMRDETINAYIYAICKNIPNKIVFISQTLQRVFPQSNNSIVIHNGTTIYTKTITDEEKQTIRNTLGITDQKIIFNVGRLVTWKGVQVLIEAIEELDDKHIICLIMGSGKDQRDNNENDLQRLVKERHLESTVKFLGWRDDAYKFFQIADIFVHPVITPEPFGLVVIEAMSFGVPVIASDAGGPSEIIQNGVNGILVQPNSVDALTSALTTLLSDEALRMSLGKNARETILASYTQEQETKQIENLYESILG